MQLGARRLRQQRIGVSDEARQRGDAEPLPHRGDLRLGVGDREGGFGNANLAGNPRYGRIGMVGLPLIVIEDVLGPPCELFGYLLIPLLYFMGIETGAVVLAFFSLTVLFGTALSMGTLALEEVQLRRTPRARDLAIIGLAAVVENLGYRQANLAFRIYGMWRFFRKDTRWASAGRAGFVRQ